MARLTMKVNGKRGINWHVARHVDVQHELKAETQFALFQAAGTLATHRHDGHAYVEAEKHDVDHYLVLNDERGQKAAMSIEFGRAPRLYRRDDVEGMVFDPGMEGVAPLRKAVGLA